MQHPRVEAVDLVGGSVRAHSARKEQEDQSPPAKMAASMGSDGSICPGKAAAVREKKETGMKTAKGVNATRNFSSTMRRSTPTPLATRMTFLIC